MKLSQIGELKLLREVRKRFSSKDSSIIIGIGDDAAVIAPQTEKIVVTTDMMNEGVHFDLSFTSPFHLGFKLVSVNASDIFAMGGKPRYLFLNIAMKNDADEEMFWKIYKGISSAMDIYKANLAGGDLCAAGNGIVLSAMLIGTGDKIITRKSASVGDKIYVTGTLGDSACGLALLKRFTDESKEIIKNLEHWSNEALKRKDITDNLYLRHSIEFTGTPSLQIDWNTAKPLIERHLMPVARDSAEIAKHATSMIDISDGLFIDLCRICDESNTGAKIYLDKIPISDEMKKTAEIMGLDPINLAASGGEDYELLFTAPAALPIAPLLKGGAEEVRVTCIGEIIEKSRIVVDEKGRDSIMKADGYQHFGSS
jgi:thiamine-monophosphate kinase